jgi:hypothetical protein
MRVSSHPASFYYYCYYLTASACDCLTDSMLLLIHYRRRFALPRCLHS